MSADATDPRVEAGLITLVRLYDVANAIALEKVEALVVSTRRIRLQRTSPKAVSFEAPPVEFPLPAAWLPALGVAEAPECLARVYDFGAVAIVLRFPVKDISWTEYCASAQRLAGLLEGEETQIWSRLLDGLKRDLAPALDRPNPEPIEEDYMVAAVHRLNPALEAAAFLQQVDLVPLLSGESRPLSRAGREELLRHSFSYYADDLVVLSWDRAFVLDTPEGSADIADVLEVANAQLLELRYYDELLDRELPRMYDRVAEARHARNILRSRRYASLARELHKMVAEVIEITERVDNALKVTEDVYHARVYTGALELFRLRTWNTSVDRKLAFIRDTYTALFEEAATARAELLELTIVVLILVELILAFVL